MLSPSRIALLFSALSVALPPTHALAQVPAHVPGTICFTQQFWCWAQPPGPPGLRCFCSGPSGPVQGVLG